MNLEHRDEHEDMEHDAFLTGIVRGWDYLTRKRWVVLSGAAVVLVAVGGVFLVMRMSRLKEERADVLLNRATGLMEAQQAAAAQPLLEKVRDDFAGTRAAEDARFFLGMNAVAADKVTEARAELTAFLDAHGEEDFLRAAAQGGLAVCLEREKKWAEAAEAWIQASLVDEAGNFNAPTYLFNAALCWDQAGKPDQVLPLLDRILEKYPKTPLKSKVEVLQARLKIDA
jgi:tetratricopeptide (TPR) repeat protein